MYIVLSFEPHDSRRLSTGDFSVSLINDTDSDLLFSFISAEEGADNRGTLLHTGQVEAGTSRTLEVVKARDLVRWQKIVFFGIHSIKGNLSTDPLPPVTAILDLGTGFWRREQEYQHPLYSDRPAMEVELAKDGEGIRPDRADPRRLKLAMGGAPDSAMQELLAKYSSDRRRKKNHPSSTVNPTKLLPPIEIDLHIGALLDSTVGMSNTDMLLHQLDTVRTTLKEHCRRAGQKIIFIHGKGEGVLRKALHDLVRREFRGYELQDASFVRFGFGATMVIIHPSNKTS